PPTPPLFPYTTLFRSDARAHRRKPDEAGQDDDRDPHAEHRRRELRREVQEQTRGGRAALAAAELEPDREDVADDRAEPERIAQEDRKSTRLNSSHVKI